MINSPTKPATKSKQPIVQDEDSEESDFSDESDESEDSEDELDTCTGKTCGSKQVPAPIVAPKRKQKCVKKKSLAPVVQKEKIRAPVHSKVRFEDDSEDELEDEIEADSYYPVADHTAYKPHTESHYAPYTSSVKQCNGESCPEKQCSGDACPPTECVEGACPLTACTGSTCGSPATPVASTSCDQKKCESSCNGPKCEPKPSCCGSQQTHTSTNTTVTHTATHAALVTPVHIAPVCDIKSCSKPCSGPKCEEKQACCSSIKPAIVETCDAKACAAPCTELSCPEIPDCCFSAITQSAPHYASSSVYEKKIEKFCLNVKCNVEVCLTKKCEAEQNECC